MIGVPLDDRMRGRPRRSLRQAHGSSGLPLLLALGSRAGARRDRPEPGYGPPPTDLPAPAGPAHPQPADTTHEPERPAHPMLGAEPTRSVTDIPK